MKPTLQLNAQFPIKGSASRLWHPMSEHTVDRHFGLSGVVGAKVVGDYALVASFICEVNIEQMEHAGVDELLVLVASIVLHLSII